MRTPTRLLGRTARTRRAAATARCYHLRDCLHGGRTVDVPAEQIATAVSAWLAKVGATSPMAQALARAVVRGDWPNAHASPNACRWRGPSRPDTAGHASSPPLRLNCIRLARGYWPR
jgi:hypothetical protein